MEADDVVEGVCICCGAKTGPLYRQYSPIVLKLTKCERCGSIADKYLEYDPVIIIVDLVLFSKEAYRHILYNTHFKSFWKLFISLLIMDAYMDLPINSSNKSDFIPKPTQTIFSNKSYVHIFDDNYSFIDNNPVNSYKNMDNDSNDPFSFATTVYVAFGISLLATTTFLVINFIFTLFLGHTALLKDKVHFLLFCKALILASSGNFFLLPALIWGNDHYRTIHTYLVFAYKFLALINAHSIIFQCSYFTSSTVLLISYTIKTSISSYLWFISTFFL